jgi:hypothetical protein
MLICSKCLQSRGRHMSTGYKCPTDTGFHPTQKFTLLIERLTPDELKVFTKRGRSSEQLEQEVARRVLKQVENTLSLYDLSGGGRLDRVQVIDALTLIKQGYEL